MFHASYIWSSACDAPPNCIHEWGPVNNHFKDFKYQQAKLRRYGATVARVSAKWMDECIIAEADAAHYAELLIDDGFDSLLSLSAMDDADWPSAVKKGHRRTIERQALASLRASL